MYDPSVSVGVCRSIQQTRRAEAARMGGFRGLNYLLDILFNM